MNPTLTLTRFADATTDAPRHDAQPYELDPVTGRVGFCELMQATADWQREREARQFWWGIADYEHGHSKADWRGTQALVVSYRKASAEAVADKLRALELRFMVVETAGKRKLETITFVLPLDEYVDDTDRYTRLAAEVIHGELGVYGVIEGSWSCTYLFRPRVNALVGGEPGELLSPSAMRSKWFGHRKLFAKKYTPATKP